MLPWTRLKFLLRKFYFPLNMYFPSLIFSAHFFPKHPWHNIICFRNFHFVFFLNNSSFRIILIFKINSAASYFHKIFSATSVSYIQNPFCPKQKRSSYVRIAGRIIWIFSGWIRMNFNVLWIHLNREMESYFINKNVTPNALYF